MGGVLRTVLGVWLEIRVIPVLLWSYTAITLGTAIAWSEPGPRSTGGLLVAIAVGVLLQGLVAHCVNEIVDWRSGTDRHPAPRAISGGSKVIAAGLIGQRGLAALGALAALGVLVLGALAAMRWGWVLGVYGAVGLAGAVLYTLPPVRAAYRPFIGEAVAFACIWACVTGPYVLQRGTLSGTVVVAGLAYAASCVAMLMMHHYLDRIPDASARPVKRTSVVLLAGRARRYATGWAAAALLLAVALAVVADARFAIAAAGLAAALALHARVIPDDPGSVTRSELGVILLGMAAGLGTAAALAPPLLWALVPPLLLVPLELGITRAVAQRLLPAPTVPAVPDGSPLRAASAPPPGRPGRGRWAIISPSERRAARERKWP